MDLFRVLRAEPGTDAGSLNFSLLLCLRLLSVLFGEPWWGGRGSDCEVNSLTCSHPRVTLGTYLTLLGWNFLVCQVGTRMALCRGVFW